MLKSTMKNIFSPVFVLSFIVIISELVIGVKSVARDPGTTWHLASGRWMVSSVSIPYNDPFLSVPRLWVSDQWLSDLIFYFIHSQYGWEGGAFLVFIVFSLITFIIMLPRVSSESRSNFLSALLVFFSTKMLQIHYLMRPVIFSFLLFSLLIWELHRWHSSKPVRLWSIPLLLLLWTQLHPSFVLSIPLMCSAGVSLFLTKKERVSKFIFVFILACTATTINPYGIELHRSIFWLGQNQYFMNLHQEWRGMSFFSDEALLALLLGLFGCVPYFFIKKIRHTISLFWIFSSAFFLVMSFVSVRYITYLGLVAAYPATVTLSYFFIRLRRAKKLIKPLFSLERVSRDTMSSSMKIVYSTLFVLTLWFASTGSYPFYSGEYGPPKDIYPYEEAKFITQTFPVSILAASPDYGGFFTWFGEGKIKPLIDDRNTLVGEDFYKEYENAEKSFQGMVEWGKRHGATLLFVKDSQSKIAIGDAAKRVFQGSIGSVYLIDQKGQG